MNIIVKNIFKAVGIWCTCIMLYFVFSLWTIIGGHGTAIGTIINYFDYNFKYENFKKIQPIMPFVVKLSIDNLNFEGYEIIELE